MPFLTLEDPNAKIKGSRDALGTTPIWAAFARHIISNLREHGLIDEDGGKGITKRRYLAYEETLEKVARRLGMEPGRLDLYLWYRKTGTVLK